MPGDMRRSEEDALRISELEAQLEHAKAALAGDNEGIRLWMLDCGALVEKHRKRADDLATGRLSGSLDTSARRPEPEPPAGQGFIIGCEDCQSRMFWLLRRNSDITFRCTNCGSNYVDDEGFGRP